MPVVLLSASLHLSFALRVPRAPRVRVTRTQAEASKPGRISCYPAIHVVSAAAGYGLRELGANIAAATGVIDIPDSVVE
jgi:hypothetical protein